ncbi:ABC transporter substrate-binding protein [bacterium]|nr:ABC transporter substrate-binding protein [bacterium]
MKIFRIFRKAKQFFEKKKNIYFLGLLFFSFFIPVFIGLEVVFSGFIALLSTVFLILFDQAVKKNSLLINCIKRTEVEIGEIFNTPIVNAIISMDLKGKITFFNFGAEQMLGYSSTEVEGKKDMLFFQDVEEIINYAKELSREINQPVSGLEALVLLPKKGVPDRNEWTFIKKNKEKILVDMVVAPIKNKKGNISGFLAIAQDITDKKNKECEIQKIKMELEASNRTLERFNRLMLGREERIVELKKEVNKISKLYGRDIIYENILDDKNEKDDLSLLTQTGVACDAHAEFVENQYKVFENSLIEKRDIDISFMPTLCSAPIMYAHSRGFFAKNGLNVTLNSVHGCGAIKELLVYGQTDAAQMLLPMLLACSLGIGGKHSDLKLLALQSVDGLALTLNIKYLKIQNSAEMKGFVFGVSDKFSMSFYLLCDFLANKGIHPLKDVKIIELSPLNMIYYLKQGWIDAFMAPEPYNQIAVYKGVGFIYLLSKDICIGHTSCSLAVKKEFSVSYPNTCHAIETSIIEAQNALRLASVEQKASIARQLSQPMYLNQTDVTPIQQVFTGEFPDGRGNNCNVHNRIDFFPSFQIEQGIWMLTQMQRWNQLREKVEYNKIVKDIFYSGGSIKINKNFGNKCVDRCYCGLVLIDKDPFKIMRAQKFCSYKEKKKSEDKNTTLSDDQRIDIILAQLANLCAGRNVEMLAVYNQDKLGYIENLINETFKNLNYSKTIFLEFLDDRDKLIAEHREKCHVGINAMMSLIEDSLKSKKEIELINIELQKESGKSRELAVQTQNRAAALEKSRRSLIAIMHDLEKEQQKALQASRAKSDFLANMSHEIRTPMNAVIGFSNLLKKSKLDEKQKEFVMNIISSGEHLMNIINDILDFSKIESGKIELEKIDFDPRFLIDDIFNVVSDKVKEKNINTFVEIANDIPCVLKGDPTRLRQILINLLNNAVKFTKKGVISINVSVKTKNSKNVNLLFSLRDTGIGIAEEKLKMIFDSFTQTDTSTSRNYGGTGLGLAICKKLVKQMKGDIYVNSKYGKGSEFVFNSVFEYVPYITDLKKYRLGKDKFGGKRIIIVVRDKQIAKVLKKFCADIDIFIGKVFLSEKNILNYLLKSLSSKEFVDIVLYDFLSENIVNDKRFGKIQFMPFEINRDKKRLIDFEGFVDFLCENLDKNDFKPAKSLGKEIKECKGIKVLVAEDNFVNQTLIQALFDEFGCEGDFVFNGKEALKKLAHNHYDLCLMDLQMPVMSGIDACKIIRDTISKNFPVIALTASVLKMDKDKCWDAGFSDYLTKPIDVNKLKKTILTYSYEIEN